MIEKSQDRGSAGAAGEFSSPGSSVCADSLVFVPPPCCRSST